jgi:phosphopantothenoylcysteine decarboxylase / phosphopantothenate---cysteine ligase
MFAGRRVLVGVSGGIAAYKVCQLVSDLVKAGAEVRVVLTNSARQFVQPLTFETLSRHRTYGDEDFWAARTGTEKPLHIELGQWAEALVLAPLTANTLAKVTFGLADNLLTNVILASECPVLLAPAMNTVMWEQEAVQRNINLLSQTARFHWSGPDRGLMACDTTGVGRMSEVEELLPHMGSLLWTKGKRDLQGKRVLISAGGTREFLDPVRFIGNPSTGKMGMALARSAFHRGAEVILVHGPTTESLPLNIEHVAVTHAQQMHHLMRERATEADFIVMNAAVADVRPRTYSAGKIPKQELPRQLELEPVPDILQDLTSRRTPGQCFIGFAAQTGDMEVAAAAKLQRKDVDFLIANPVDQADAGFAHENNQAIFLPRHGSGRLVPLVSKLELAHRMWDFVLKT